MKGGALMSRYKELDLTLQMIARNKAEYRQFKEMVTRHFEGKYVLPNMPDVLVNALMEWENEQIIRKEV